MSQKFKDPFQEARKAAASLRPSDPLKDVRAALDAMKASTSSIQAALGDSAIRESLQIPAIFGMSAMQEAVGATRADLGSSVLQESLDAARTALGSSAFEESLNAVHAVLGSSVLQESLDAVRIALASSALQESLRAVRAALGGSALQESIEFVRAAFGGNELRTEVAAIRDMMRGLDLSLHAMSAGLQVGLASKETDGVIDPDDLGPHLKGLVARAESNDQHPAQALQAILQEIRNLKDTRTQRALYLVIIPVLIGLFMSFVDPIASAYVEGKILPRERTTTRIRESIVAACVTKPTSGFGVYIARRETKVRSQPRKRGQLIATIQPGQIVMPIQKRKRWLLVGFADRDGRMNGFGWVRSKSVTPVGH
jgi:hypothetical protein